MRLKEFIKEFGSFKAKAGFKDSFFFFFNRGMFSWQDITGAGQGTNIFMKRLCVSCRRKESTHPVMSVHGAP